MAGSGRPCPFKDHRPLDGHPLPDDLLPGPAGAVASLDDVDSLVDQLIILQKLGVGSKDGRLPRPGPFFDLLVKLFLFGLGRSQGLLQLFLLRGRIFGRPLHHDLAVGVLPDRANGQTG